MTSEQIKKNTFSAVIALKFSRIVFPSIRLPLISHNTTHQTGPILFRQKKDRKESFTFINYCNFPFNSTESERITRPSSSILVSNKRAQIYLNLQNLFSACVIVFLSTSALEEEKNMIVCVSVHGENNGGGSGLLTVSSQLLFA